MKVLIPIVIGLLVVGCGKKQSTNTNDGNSTPEKPAKQKEVKETPSKGEDKNSTTAKTIKDLTLEEVEKIAAQPHQPILNNPQLIKAVLKVGVWESVFKYEFPETSKKAPSSVLERKTIKKIKHVHGKYVVIETRLPGVKVFTEVLSYDRQANVMHSTGVSAKGSLSRMVGVLNSKTRTIKWKSVPTENDPRDAEITITCAEDGLSAQLQGRTRTHREGTLLATFTGELKRIGDLPDIDSNSNQVKSVHNARIISQSLRLKNGKYSANSWCDDIKNKADVRDVNQWIFLCPQLPQSDELYGKIQKARAANTNPKDLWFNVSHYALNSRLSGKSPLEAMRGVDGELVTVFECDLGWNGTGGLDDALKYMDKYELEKIAVAQGSSARRYTREQLKKLTW